MRPTNKSMETMALKTMAKVPVVNPNTTSTKINTIAKMPKTIVKMSVAIDTVAAITPSITTATIPNAARVVSWTIVQKLVGI